MSKFQMTFITILILTTLSGVFSRIPVQFSLPVTSVSALGTRTQVSFDMDAARAPAVTVRSRLPLLSTFAREVKNQNSQTVVGVYVPGEFALPVVQQPHGQAAYVSTEPDTITQFSLAEKYGAVGLLAHNYLSGEEFFKLKPNQYIIVLFGDGRMDYYRVTAAESYQALVPNSPYSDFVNLDDPTGKVITSSELFKHVYTRPDTLVFQTCINANGDPSWGRLFVTAEKVDIRQGQIMASN